MYLPLLTSRITVWLLTVALAACANLRAQTALYLDLNGTATGSGIANGATITWDNASSANWNASAAGTGTPGAWSAVATGATNGTATFSAGTDAGAAYTVNISGNIPNLGGLKFEEGDVTLAGDATLPLAQDTVVNVGLSRTATINLPIIGSVGLIVNGNGVLKLNGASTYAGTTRLSGATVQVGRDSVSSGGVIASGPLGTGLLLISSGQLSSDSATPRSLANPIVIQNSATLGTKSNNDRNNGAITLSGSVDLGGIRSFPTSIFMESPVTITGVISNGGFTKFGFATLTLTGANTYTGGTGFGQIGGTIQVGSSSVLSEGAIVSGPLGTGEVAFNFDSRLCSDSTAARSLANPIKLQRGVVLGDTVNNGALVLSGTVDLNNLSWSPFFGGEHAIASSVTLTGVISNGALNVGGTGVLTITGANTYAGGSFIGNRLRVQVGRDSISNGGMIVSGPLGTGTLALGGGTLSSNSTTARSLANAIRIEGGFTFGDAASSGALALSGPVELNGAPVTLIVNSPVTLSGIISGRSDGIASLRTSGPGALTLTGANTYNGGTTIMSGTLIAGGSGALGTGNVTVNAGGTLAFQAGAKYAWRLTSLTTQGAGTSHTLITLSGNARLETNSVSLAPNFGVLADPTSGNAFWSAARTWTIVSGNANSIITGTFAVDNSTWSAVGSFAVAQSGNDLLLAWTPVSKALAFTMQPVAQIVASGGTVAYGVTVTGAPAPTYQWYRNGSAIPGATNALLILKNTSATDAGSYTCVATNPSGSLTSAAATLGMATTSSVSRLINLSILGSLAAGETMTLGTVLRGLDGTLGAKSLLARAVGPSLAAFNVGDPLPDPKMTLSQIFPGATIVIATNDNWNGDAALSNAFAKVGAFGYANATTKDAAILKTGLNSNSYVVEVSDATRAGGTVLAELYDATPAAAVDPKQPPPRLINVSVNKQIARGTPLTAGFVIGGTTAKTVLIRAVGPSLNQFGVGSLMPDPRLDLFDQTGAVFASNDDWGGSAALTDVMRAVGAFGMVNGSSADAALLVTLAPGNYSAQAQPSGASAGGIALVEVYEVP